jgi:hypothetical protein
MANEYSSSPFILPSQWGAPGRSLDDLIESQYQNRERQERKKEQYRLFNIRELDQDTDLSKFRTGREVFDKYTQKEIEKIKNKALSEYMSLPPEEAKYKIGQDMKNLVEWHNAVSSNISNIESGLNEFKKTYSGTVDMLGANDIAYSNLANDFLERDASGEFVRKSPAIVGQRNYVSELLNPENLNKLNVNTSVFQKAIEGIPKTMVGDKEYKSKRGVSHKFNWSGYKTDYSEMQEDESGRPQRFGLATDRKSGDIRLIPQNLKDYLINQPSVKVAADRLWNEEKQRIESKQGEKIDPRIEDEVKDAFLYNLADKYLPHDIRIEKGETIPKSVTNVYMPRQDAGTDFTSGGKTTGNELDKVKKEINLPSDDYTGDWTAYGSNIPALTRAVLKTGGIDIEPGKEIRLVYKNGVLQEIRAIDGKEKIVDRDEMVIAQKKYDAERKGEAQAFGAKKDEKPSASSYLIKGKKYSESELLKMGYSLDDIKPYKQ